MSEEDVFHFQELTSAVGVLLLAPWLPTLPLHSRGHGRHQSLWKVAMKVMTFEGNREAREALTLSVAGVLTIMLVWNVMMLLFY
jgi:hypothetical protein